MKLVLCSLLQHLCDCQVQHRIEAIVTFATGYVDSLQEDQKERHSSTFAKRPKEFRSTPERQVKQVWAVTFAIFCSQKLHMYSICTYTCIYIRMYIMCYTYTCGG